MLFNDNQPSLCPYDINNHSNELVHKVIVNKTTKFHSSVNVT